MSIEELKENLNYFIQNQVTIGVVVYALLKSDPLTPKKLDIEATALPDIKKLFLEGVRRDISEKEELHLLNLSSSDERLNAIYLYDIEIPGDFSAMQTVIAQDNLPCFNLSNDDISNIKAFLIEIGDNQKQVVLYKTFAPIHIFGQSGFFLKKSNQRFEKVNDIFIRISSGFQLMRLDGNLFVLDLETIEKFFGFHEVIKKEATKGIDAIQSMGILENTNVLNELLDDVKFARKLTKVAYGSPVIKLGISNSQIIEFCKNFPALKGKIRFNEAGDKVNLDTKVSKNLFIQMLLDNLLTSELTKLHYASVAKDTVDSEVVAQNESVD